MNVPTFKKKSVFFFILYSEYFEEKLLKSISISSSLFLKYLLFYKVIFTFDYIPTNSISFQLSSIRKQLR